MKQAKIHQIRAEKDLENLPKIMDNRMKTYAGFLYQSQEFDTFSHTPEEREAFFEKTWEMVSMLSSSSSAAPEPHNKTSISLTNPNNRADSASSPTTTAT